MCAAILAGLALFPSYASAATAVQVVIVGEGVVQRPGDPSATCPPTCRLTFLGRPEFAPTDIVDGRLAVPAPGWSFAQWTVDPSTAIAFPGFTCEQLLVCTLRFVLGADLTFPEIPATVQVITVTATFVRAPEIPPAAVARGPDGAFLCYSKFQVDPGVWPEDEAAALLAKGYWRPTAVPGAVSATRLGAYSLVCNPPTATRVVDHGFVDDGGSTIVAVGEPWVGLYPIGG